MGVLFTLMAKLGLDKSEYDQGIDGAKKSASTFAQVLGANLATKGIGLVTKGLTNASKKMIGFAKDSVSTGMEFDAAMAQVAATMGKTVGEIQDLQEYAQKMGATTKFTATESADALNYMALAGYDADMSMKMLPNVLNLAAAGNMDLAAASDMVTDSQSALDLSTEETTALVDKMAKASSKSNTSVAQLGDAILTVGGTAKNVKGGTTALATALGILADNGIKGAEGGTALRNIINTLAAPTGNAAKRFEALGVKVFDSTGNMRGLNEVFGDLSESMSTLTQEQRMEALSDIFNVRDLKSAEALLANYGQRWDELSASIDDAQGAAQKMADTQLDNLQGDITLLKSAADGAKQSFSKGLTPALRDIAQTITKKISGTKVKKFLKEAGEKLGDIAKTVVNLAMNALPKLAKLFVDGGKKVKIFAGAVAAAVITIKACSSWISALATAAKLLVGALSLAWLTETEHKFRLLGDAAQEIVDNANDAADSYKDLRESYEDSVSAIDANTNKTRGLWQELQSLVDADGKVLEGNENRVDFILGALNDALGTEYERNGDLIEQYDTMKQSIGDLITQRQAEALMSSGEDAYKEALNNRASALEAVALKERELERQGQILKSAEEDLADFERQHKEEIDGVSGSIADLYQLNGALALEWEKHQEAVANAQAAYNQFDGELSNMKGDLDLYYSDVARYEDAQAAMLEGNYTKAINLMSDQSAYKWKTYSDDRALSLLDLKQFKSDLDQKAREVKIYRERYEAGMAGYTESELKEMEASLAELQHIYDQKVNQAKTVGTNIGLGLANGIKSTRDQVVSAADEVARAAMKQLKSVPQISSPSKVTTRFGRFIGQGYAGGMRDEIDNVKRAAEDLANSALSAPNSEYFSGNGNYTGVGRNSRAGQENGILGELVALLKDIRANMGQQLVLDTGVIAGAVDNILGRTAALKARGN